ncbi:MAG: hypothetical protein AB7E81_01470 [Hyphomicrobiaceae bacterium]
MQRSGNSGTPHKVVDITIRDLMACHDAGEDPRHTIARLNQRIVDCQRTGADLPPGYLRLSRRLAAECIAQSQDRY